MSTSNEMPDPNQRPNSVRRATPAPGNEGREGMKHGESSTTQRISFLEAALYLETEALPNHHNTVILAVCAAAPGIGAVSAPTGLAVELGNTCRVLLAEFPQDGGSPPTLTISSNAEEAPRLAGGAPSATGASALRPSSRWLEHVLGDLSPFDVVVVAPPPVSDARYPAIFAAVDEVVVTFQGTADGLRELSAAVKSLAALALTHNTNLRFAGALPVLAPDEAADSCVLRLAALTLGPEFLLPAIPANPSNTSPFKLVAAHLADKLIL